MAQRGIALSGWYYDHGNGRVGPLGIDDVKSHVAKGWITRETVLFNVVHARKGIAAGEYGSLFEQPRTPTSDARQPQTVPRPLWWLIAAACVLVALIWTWAASPSPQTTEDQPIVITSEMAATSDTIDKMIAAKDENARMAAAWPIVLSRSKRTEVFWEDTDAPVRVSLEFAENPYEWSTCSATREIVEDTDPATIRVELAKFVFHIPWRPTKDVFKDLVLGYPGEGETELLQWQLEDDSDETAQRFKLRFRLKQSDVR